MFRDIDLQQNRWEGANWLRQRLIFAFESSASSMTVSLLLQWKEFHIFRLTRDDTNISSSSVVSRRWKVFLPQTLSESLCFAFSNKGINPEQMRKQCCSLKCSMNKETLVGGSLPGFSRNLFFSARCFFAPHGHLSRSDQCEENWWICLTGQRSSPTYKRFLKENSDTNNKWNRFVKGFVFFYSGEGIPHCFQRMGRRSARRSLGEKHSPSSTQEGLNRGKFEEKRSRLWRRVQWRWLTKGGENKEQTLH